MGFAFGRQDGFNSNASIVFFDSRNNLFKKRLLLIAWAV